MVQSTYNYNHAQYLASRNQQRKKTVTDKAEVNGNSAPTPNDTFKNVADIGISGWQLYNQYNKPQVGTGINSGSNVPSAQEQTNSQDINTGENIQSETPDNTPTSYMDDDYIYVNDNEVYEDNLFSYDDDLLQDIGDFKVSLQENIRNGDVPDNSISLDKGIRGESKFYEVKNKDGNTTIIPNDIVNSKGETVTKWGGQEWHVPNDAYTIGQVALPILEYAANYQQLDSKNRWVQGGKAIQRMLEGFAGRDPVTGRPNPTMLDNTYISNFVDVVDMSMNWHDRTHFQNALTGINTATNIIKNFGLEDMIGGADMLYAAKDGVALLNFGSSLYYLSNNWGDMNDQERTAAALQTMVAGWQAYDGGVGIINAFKDIGSAQAANMPVATSVNGGTILADGTTVGTEASTMPVATSVNGGTVLADGTTVGAEESAAASSGVVSGSTAGMIGGGVTALAGAYSMYQGIKGMSDAWGIDSADSRKAMAAAGAGVVGGAVGVTLGAAMMSTTIASAIGLGATIGSVVPIVGTIIGAAVGAVIGTALGTINAGKSGPQRARDNWRDVYQNAGVFQVDSRGSHCMQLDDGTWYDVGVDGKDSYATFADGSQKTWADPTQFTNADGSVRKMNPYDVDYTNGLDFAASLMLTAMSLPMGGTIAKLDTKEASQMLGYMTNGVTANCGRELNLENFNIVAKNIRKLYSTIGIVDKESYGSTVAEAFFSGKLSTSDYHAALASGNMIYDDNGFEIANNMMTAAGKENTITASNSNGGEQ